MEFSRGRVCPHDRQLADLRHNGDAGNEQKGGMMRRYYGNGAEVGMGWWGGLRPYGLPVNIFQDKTVFVFGLALYTKFEA